MRKAAAGFDALCREQWQTIESLVTLEAAEAAVTRAATDTIALLGRPILRLAGWGWSGGKDSLALEVLVDELRRRIPGAVPGGVCGMIRPLEFPNFNEWVDDNLPEGVCVLSNDALTLEWLARPENAKYVFKSVGVEGTTSGGLDTFWTMQGTRRAQTQFGRAVHPTVMLYGRRREDKNVCGDSRGLMRSKAGLVHNPIREWDHLTTLAVIHYLWLPGRTRSGEPRRLPPIYDGEDGWSTGTATWPSRRLASWTSRDDGWASTYAIDPRAVEDAATRLPDAARWLRGRTASRRGRVAPGAVVRT